jgi:hypothetical protein
MKIRLKEGLPRHGGAETLDGELMECTSPFLQGLTTESVSGPLRPCVRPLLMGEPMESSLPSGSASLT